MTFIERAVRCEGDGSWLWHGETRAVEEIPEWLTKIIAGTGDFPSIQEGLKAICNQEIPEGITVVDLLGGLAGIYASQLTGRQEFPQVTLIIDKPLQSVGIIGFRAMFSDDEQVTGNIYLPSNLKDERLAGLPWYVDDWRKGLTLKDYFDTATGGLKQKGTEAIQHLGMLMTPNPLQLTNC